MDLQKRVLVGKILSPWGVKGLVKIKSLTENPADLFSFSPLWGGPNQTPLELVKHPGDSRAPFLLGRVGHVMCRSRAEYFRGWDIVTDRAAFSSIKSLGTEAFYYCDLVGLSVLDLQDRHWGSVLNVHNFGAGDLLEVGHCHASFFLPFNKSTVVRVDLVAGTLCLDRQAITAFLPPHHKICQAC